MEYLSLVYVIETGNYQVFFQEVDNTHGKYRIEYFSRSPTGSML